MARVLALLVVAGCTSATFAFSPTATVVSSKPDNCPVDVVTSPPSRTFQEIGTLDFYNGTEPTTLDAFKQAVAKQVCSVGGDAVIAVSNIKGQFTKGTIIGYVGPATPAHINGQQNDNELPK
jgi:hypothetical protein